LKLSKFIWQFDVLRGVAVLVVMVFHLGHNWRSGMLEPYTTWGWWGVDLFFILSGFLITGILLETRDAPDYFRTFYVRRILRIWPLYFGLLTTMMVFLPRVAPALSAPSIATAYPRWAYLLFIQNWYTHKVLGPLSVTWSLAVEEQFYIVWPTVVWLLSAKRLKTVLLFLIPAAPIGRLVIAYCGISADTTATRMDGLAVGALLAILVRELDASTIRKIGTLAVVPAGVAAVLAFRANWTWLLFSLLAVTFGSILCLALTTNLIPRSGFFSYTGKISFGLYLLHLPSFDLLRSGRIRNLLPQGALANDLCYSVLAFAATYLVASVSWFCMEKPILQLKRHFGRIANPHPSASAAWSARGVAQTEAVCRNPAL
jgi:peptidoglycan/LPS O-acetylase OafA/YrhL